MPVPIALVHNRIWQSSFLFALADPAFHPRFEDIDDVGVCIREVIVLIGVLDEVCRVQRAA